MRTPTGRLAKHPKDGTRLAALMLVLWRNEQNTTRPLYPWSRLGELARATKATKGATSANLGNLIRRGIVCRTLVEVPEHGEVWVYRLTDFGAAAFKL